MWIIEIYDFQIMIHHDRWAKQFKRDDKKVLGTGPRGVCKINPEEYGVWKQGTPRPNSFKIIIFSGETTIFRDITLI